MTDQQMLQYIYENAEMGRDSISHLMPFVKDHAMHEALHDQLDEYRTMCDRTSSMLRDRGDTPEGAGTVAKMMTRLAGNLKAMTDPSPSHIAEMMIEGNTMGVTQMTRHLNDFKGDAEIRRLAEEHRRTAQNNIERMKPFL